MLKLKKVYINPLSKENPLYYTSKGKIRKRFNNPFNYPKTKPKSENEEIPEKIQDILVGRYAAFAFKQSVKHKEYLFYIYFIFLHWGYAHPFSVPIERICKDSVGNFHKYLRFRTITSPNLFKIYKMFYKDIDGKITKTVPIELYYYLTPRVLAFWIMDDGSKDGKGILLHSNSFKYEEVLFLINILKEKFNIESITRKKYNNHIIYIYAKSVPLLIKLIKVHMHPKFFYKIGIS